jgi:hypothetical protein
MSLPSHGRLIADGNAVQLQTALRRNATSQRELGKAMNFGQLPSFVLTVD